MTQPTPQPAQQSEMYEPPMAEMPIDYHGSKRSLLRQDWVQKYLPVLTSLGIHLMVVLLGALVVYSGAAEFIVEQVQREQVVITDAAVIDDSGEIGGLVNPGLNDDLTTPAAQMEDESVSNSSAFSETRNEELSESLLQAGGTDTTANVIGAGQATRGTATGPGSAFGGGGRLAPFGRPGGGSGIGPASSIFGNTSNLRSIAYVCDASGSMVGERDIALQNELLESIAGLKPIQFFNIIFFSSGTPQTLSEGALLPAKSSVKQDATTFIEEIEYRGTTQPIPGLEIAFRQRPQLIWLLTDGAFPDPDKVLAYIREQNEEKTVRINTILFLNNDPIAAETLRTIAEENGGTFKIVTRDDLTR